MHACTQDMFHHLRPALRRHTALDEAVTALHALLASEGGGGGLLGVIEEEDEDEERRGGPDASDAEADEAAQDAKSLGSISGRSSDDGRCACWCWTCRHA